MGQAGERVDTRFDSRDCKRRRFFPEMFASSYNLSEPDGVAEQFEPWPGQKEESGPLAIRGDGYDSFPLRHTDFSSGQRIFTISGFIF